MGQLLEQALDFRWRWQEKDAYHGSPEGEEGLLDIAILNKIQPKGDESLP